VLVAALARENIVLAADSHSYAAEGDALVAKDMTKVLPMWGRYALAWAGFDFVLDPLRFPRNADNSVTVVAPVGVELTSAERNGASPWAYSFAHVEEELGNDPPPAFNDFGDLVINVAGGCLAREAVYYTRPQQRMDFAIAGFEAGMGHLLVLRFERSPEHGWQARVVRELTGADVGILCLGVGGDEAGPTPGDWADSKADAIDTVKQVHAKLIRDATSHARPPGGPTRIVEVTGGGARWVENEPPSAVAVAAQRGVRSEVDA
jgi:hypothetical protein